MSTTNELQNRNNQNSFAPDNLNDKTIIILDSNLSAPPSTNAGAKKINVVPPPPL